MATKTHSSYGFGTTVSLPFDEAIARVTEALKAEGFGVLTSIDVKATMKNKLNVDFDRYTILGACNPPLAHRALTLEPEVGLLLPCNVVIRGMPVEGEKKPQTRIEIADPVAMLGIVLRPEMRDLATEAKTRLQRVIAAIAST
jgi:uncharacterized protein (DUF302 family)